MFISESVINPVRAHTWLNPRAGGSGRHGSTGDSSGSSSGGSSGSSSGSGYRSGGGGGGNEPELENITSSDTGTLVTVTGGIQRSASPFSIGGGPEFTISGELFNGSRQGGGTREQVYGTSEYGSGYPGISPGGFRGFPFYFWPISWGAGPGPAYLHSEGYYGKPDNTSRPGGPMYHARLTSVTNDTRGITNTTFRIVADNYTVSELVIYLWVSCNAYLTQGINLNTSSFPVPVPLQNNSTQVEQPRPENAIRYYRASSVALTLDTYYNTAVFSPGEPPTSLPQNMDSGFKDCLDRTIGQYVPLIDFYGSNGALGFGTRPGVGIGQVALMWVVLAVIFGL